MIWHETCGQKILDCGRVSPFLKNRARKSMQLKPN